MMVTAIDLKADSELLFFLIHGYTGSPDDFNELPEYLHKNIKANVKVILLKGHGTRIEDLDNLGYFDFLKQIEAALNQEIHKGYKIIIGGLSFGAQIALILASRYPVQGVFNICLPYQLKFPFNIPGLKYLKYCKKYWNKLYTKEETKLRKNKFYYQQMHANSLEIVMMANEELKKSLPNIDCPLLSIHSKYDPIGNYKAMPEVEVMTNSSLKENIVFESKNHNIFFSENRFEVYKTISRFFQVKSSNDEEKIDSVAAIIPAYNEGERIGLVLDVLSNTKIIQEIVVIDDGSTDTTSEVVKRYQKVILLRNEKNRGKSYSMQRGVEATKSSILFFCDADLEKLTPKIVEQIITPVKNNTVSMFIGLRNNLMQKSILLFALNSGERALRREIWEKLPKQFKYRYRIEAGLNYIANSQGKGYDYKIFDYYQTLKEKKYGFMQGTILRWWMNLDVGWAYILVMINRLKEKI